MGKIPEHVLEDIARVAGIARVVGQYVELTQKGGRYWGLCPFHQEKTPSFTVGEKGYKCFGCNEGGSVFDFLMKMEGITFIEAVQSLARTSGIDLSQYGGAGERGELDELRRIHEFAADFYSRMLSSQPGEKAREYLTSRRINEESRELWRIGYAPDGWHNLEQAARGEGFSENIMLDSGLAVKSEQGTTVYDRFRGRLMFPVTDRQGRVVGFAGRVLEEDEYPKYLNSPETGLFSKSRCLFGLPEARQTIRQTREAIVVEGYTDVILAHQFGFKDVIGLMGTALTGSHVRQLRGLELETLVLLPDNDEAGIKACLKSGSQVFCFIPTKVCLLPKGKDPADILTEGQGKKTFQTCLNNSPTFFEFFLGRQAESLEAKKVSPASIDGTFQLLQSASEIVSSAPNNIQPALISILSQRTGVNQEVITELVFGEELSKAREHTEHRKNPYAERTALEQELIKMIVTASAQERRGLLGLLAVRDGLTPAFFKKPMFREVFYYALSVSLPDEESYQVAKPDIFLNMNGDMFEKGTSEALAREITSRAEERGVIIEEEKLRGFLAGLTKRKYKPRKGSTLMVRASELAGMIYLHDFCAGTMTQILTGKSPGAIRKILKKAEEKLDEEW